MFSQIRQISDVQPMVVDKPEIKFSVQPNGITIGCYVFADSKTFDSVESIECRGIAFDANGDVVSRPLHKFFNVGERQNKDVQWLREQENQNLIAAIFEKVDGSMIATAKINDSFEFRSKKAFHSDVVKLANEYILTHDNVAQFCHAVTEHNLTAIFELTHPQARIVVDPKVPHMQLLHVRDNITGAYVLLDKTHYIHGLVQQYNIPCVKSYQISVDEMILSLETMENQEGYVIQFVNGDMVKLKCPWYLRLHHAVTFLRERDIALLALREELDDVKAGLVESGIDLTEVNQVESSVKQHLINISTEIESIISADRQLSRKDFAIKHRQHPMFGLLMAKYIGKDEQLSSWFERHKLKELYTLRVLANVTLEE